MFAEIIPQIRTIPSLGVFDYKIPDNLDLKIGDIIKISFRNSEKIGLVYKIKKTCKYKKVKPIMAKVGGVSLSLAQVELIGWIAKKYKISLALAFKTVFPEIPKKKRTYNAKNDIVQSQNISIQKNRINDIKTSIKNLSKNKKPAILHYNNVNEKNAVLVGLVKQNQNKQILIITPEKQQAINLAKIFTKFSPAIIYSGLSKNQEWKIWQDVKGSKIKIIIGTKNAIFVPPDNLDLIIIDDEEDKSHKNYDQNPKYHVLDVAKKLNKKIILTSQAPLVSSYYNFNHVDLFIDKKNKVEIVDMEEEKKAGNYSYFSDKLIKSLEQYKKSLLIFNRKGKAKLLLCKNCKEIIPYSKTTNCHHCQGLDLKQISFGTTKLKIELKKILPNKKIIEITKNNHDSQNYQDYDIVIGTEFAMKKIDLTKIDFIGLISVDHQLVIPDYQASERVYQLMTKLINLNKPLVAQTHSPDNIVIKNAMKNKYKIFFDYELKLRRQFNYPPFDKM